MLVSQETSCVWVRVYYFSREYPAWTGQQSIFDDRLSFEVTNPGGILASGSTTVNALDASFGSGPFPGGNFLVVDELFDFSLLTAAGDSWVEARATTVNIGDGLYGSGVGFIDPCIAKETEALL